MNFLNINHPLDDTELSVFDSIISNLKKFDQEKIIPLHQGKTVFTAPIELRKWNSVEFDYPHYHDGPSSGSEILINEICNNFFNKTGQTINPGRIQITNGITHGLSIIFHAILRPSDEVIVLSPHWLFVNGLIRASNGIPVEVPFFPTNNNQFQLIEDIEKHLIKFVTKKTKAIYFNSPNNPTGKSIPLKLLNDLVQFTKDNKLWLVSDNAYEHYDYSPDGFIDPITLTNGQDHIFSIYSFSKSFGLTGYRIGYLISPENMAILSRKLGLYSIYSTSTCSQFIALSAMRNENNVINNYQSFIKKSISLAVQQLCLPITHPDGGFYTFIDLSKWEHGVDDFIEKCIARGVSLAPGRVFGQSYFNYARLCYSVVNHEDLQRGIEIINRIWRQGQRI